MPILIDLAILGIITLFVILGYKHGFVRSFVGFICSILILYLSFWLAGIISQLIYDTFISGYIIEQIKLALEKSIQSSINNKGLIITESLPIFISKPMSVFGVTPEIINRVIENNSNSAVVEIEKIIKPVIISIIKSIVMTLVFTLAWIPLRFLVRTISRVTRLPILRQLDGTLGALFGLLKVIIILLVFMVLLRTYIQVIDYTPALFSEENIMKTGIFKIFYYKNPIYNFFSEIFTTKI